MGLFHEVVRVVLKYVQLSPRLVTTWTRCNFRHLTSFGSSVRLLSEEQMESVELGWPDAGLRSAKVQDVISGMMCSVPCRSALRALRLLSPYSHVLYKAGQRLSFKRQSFRCLITSRDETPLDTVHPWDSCRGVRCAVFGRMKARHTVRLRALVFVPACVTRQ